MLSMRFSILGSFHLAPSSGFLDRHILSHLVPLLRQGSKPLEKLDDAWCRDVGHFQKSVNWLQDFLQKWQLEPKFDSSYTPSSAPLRLLSRSCGWTG